ncbi:uncharacterized protein LOC131221911 isoform X1 [Magnolia sinica]|uniref:uncharacterized protein LOC131221911 isoform X1 n=1 Tax=Magnolia sinica TaxID=86752 RepID=UPI002659D91B|nr:uncharacterized protein LOC131221911 isoform X1 [Magnolia sinica]
MGFFKVLYSTVRNACRRLYNLGCAAVRKIWPAGASESLHLTAVKLTNTVTNTCKSSYDLCCAAVMKVDNAVRVAGEQIVPDSQVREKIGGILLAVLNCGVDITIRKRLKGYTCKFPLLTKISLGRDSDSIETSPWFYLQLYNIVGVGLKSRRPSDHGNKKPKCSEDEEKMEELRKEKDKMKEEMNIINYHLKILLEQIQILVQWIKPFEFPNEKLLLESVQKLEDVTSPCEMEEEVKVGD